ncbi:MAG TPA: hypothetical protein VLD58_06950 [Gemmatimonadales bacterium]|nr:hypothetical protein [Gemmatimonadales bacterium]
MRALGHTFILAALWAGPVSGQALAPETGAVGELRRSGGPTELVLGTTTIQQVRQLYASRQLHEALANARAPRTLSPAPRWRMGGATIAPRYRVDGADGFYTLSFDASERLVLAVNDQPRERLSRAEFQARYPKAKLAQHVGQASILEVALEPCVTMSAMFTGPGATLTQAGYGYTCGNLVPASD